MLTVAILGLGLIGGSLGLALRQKRPALRVIGIDRADVISEAAAALATTEVIDIANVAATNSALEADLVVLAIPVSAIQSELPRVLERAKVVIDCGSTKRRICEVVREHPRRAAFVPSHPMAGAAEGGIDRANESLFEGKRWIICPEKSSPEAVASAKELIIAAGAQVVTMSAEAHDRAVARTSHLPQLMASALAVVADRVNAEVAAGPAFGEAVRIAGGPDAMWRDIFATNPDELSSALGEFIEELGVVGASLARPRPDVGPAQALLRRAREVRKGRR